MFFFDPMYFVFALPALVRIDAPQGAMARRAMMILRAYGVQGIRSGAVR